MEWKVSTSLIDYPEAIRFMETRVAAIASGQAEECVWLLEHPPLYTAGTSARKEDLLSPKRFPVYETGRGGEYTYHGPGQQIAYVMLNLKARQHELDLRKFVWQLEEWIIATLTAFGVTGERRQGRIGIWVELPGGGEAKIAALGIRVRKGISYHGIAINVTPDLSHFSGIVPCGIKEYGVTSLQALGIVTTLAEVQKALQEQFGRVFKGGYRF